MCAVVYVLSKGKLNISVMSNVNGFKHSSQVAMIVEFYFLKHSYVLIRII